MEHPEYSDIVISAKTLSELMTAAETILTQESPTVLQHLTIPETGRMIFVGDTHGQLQDVLPSRENGGGSLTALPSSTGDVSACITTNAFFVLAWSWPF